MNNLTGIFKVKKGSQQNDQTNQSNETNESSNMRAPIGFEAFGSPNDQNVAQADPVANRFPGDRFFDSGFNSSTFPSFEPKIGDFGAFSGSNSSDFGFPSGFGGTNFPSFESRFGDIGNFGGFGGFDQGFRGGFDGFGGNPKNNNDRGGNSVNIPVRPAPPKRPDPPRPSEPSDNTKPGKSGFLDQAGRKIYGDIKNGIFSRFGELTERRKDFDGFRKKFDKEPKRFRESFNYIIKECKIANFIPSQDYKRISQNHSVRNPFVDNEFKACNGSLGYSRNFLQRLESRNYRGGGNVWKRAKDIVDEAHFVVDENQQFVRSASIDGTNYKKIFNTTDFDQGALGNCWFISAAVGIIQNYSLFKKVVPFENSFEEAEYTGAFHFRFWIFGEWKDVVIDDYLLVDSNNNLVFSKNRDHKSEFWCALLEKAYAKVCGSYEALDGGLTTDALIDMSGGIDEEFDLKKIRNTMYSSSSSSHHATGKSNNVDYNTFWDILVTARKKQSVIGSNINSGRIEGQLANGLVTGHAYIITKMAEVSVYGTDHKILRVYNPWGNEVEWNGEWSDKSRIWNQLSNESKEELELKIESDGEFWMSYKDWVSNFEMCQICNLTPTTSDIHEQDWENSRVLSNIFSMWQCQMFHGEWIRGLNAGGRGEPNREKFWMNPQFSFMIGDNDIVKDDKCWVIIGLMQKFTRQKRSATVDSAEDYIQYRLFKLKNTQEFIEDMQSSNNQIESGDLERVDSSGPYINKREVTARFNLSKGAYVIIPTTFDEGNEGEFLIRIFTEKPLCQSNCVRLSSGKKIKQTVIHSAAPNDANFNDSDNKRLMKDLKNLSVNAGDVLSGFVNVASDFVKEDRKKNSNCTQM